MRSALEALRGADLDAWLDAYDAAEKAVRAKFRGALANAWDPCFQRILNKIKGPAGEILASWLSSPLTAFILLIDRCEILRSGPFRLPRDAGRFFKARQTRRGTTAYVSRWPARLFSVLNHVGLFANTEPAVLVEATSALFLCSKRLSHRLYSVAEIRKAFTQPRQLCCRAETVHSPMAASRLLLFALKLEPRSVSRRLKQKNTFWTAIAESAVTELHARENCKTCKPSWLVAWRDSPYTVASSRGLQAAYAGMAGRAFAASAHLRVSW
jgi:hypothetical protein